MRFFLIFFILLSIAVNPVEAKYARLFPPADESATFVQQQDCSMFGKGWFWRWIPTPGCRFRIY